MPPKQQKTAKDYFDAIAARVAELDALGQAYLDRFDFIPSDQMAERIWNKAWEIFKKQFNSDWNAAPEEIANICDCGVPFTPYAERRNGSLFHALAYSVVSRDAHLRNLLERIEGRETKELGFPIMAEQPNI